MRNFNTLVFALLLAPALASADTLCDDAIASKQHDNINMNLHLDPDFNLQNNKLLISARDGTEYSITRDGDLFINQDPQKVSAQTRSDLASYVAGYVTLETSAKKIAGKATGLAISALTHALVALVTQGEDAVDAAVEEKTEKMTAAIENDAQNLCHTILDLRDTERRIRAEIPEFGPFFEFELTKETTSNAMQVN